MSRSTSAIASKTKTGRRSSLVKVGVYSGSKLLDRANRARTDSTSATPYDLWQLADREAGGVDAKRREIYLHAMLHAGYLVDADEKRYDVCRVCEEKLG